MISVLYSSINSATLQLQAQATRRGPRLMSQVGKGREVLSA
jgi:hypothetical protein